MPAPRILIIANPIAGGHRGSKVSPLLREALVERGAAAEIAYTAASGDAERRAAAMGPGEFDAVVAVGGDGTLNEVVNGLSDLTTPLTVLPMGTGNVLARALHLPRQPAQLADMLLDGAVCRAAVGMANGRRFLQFCSAGLDARMVARLEAAGSRTLGRRKWLGPILHTIRHWPTERVSFTTAEGEQHRDLGSVLVTRIDNYATILKLPGEIAIDDGVLHVFGFPQRTRFQFARATLRALFRRLRPGRDVVHCATRGLRIEGEGGPWQLDGDVGGRLPLDITVLPTPAHLLVPRRDPATPR